jgi:hypothetical protein
MFCVFGIGKKDDFVLYSETGETPPPESRKHDPAYYSDNQTYFDPQHTGDITRGALVHVATSLLNDGLRPTNAG